MKVGGKGMKLLKVDNNCGHYRNEKGSYVSIDKISKEELLNLLNWTLHEEAVEFDDYNEKTIKNHAHQIIYNSIVKKLRALRDRRQEFTDESARLFLEDYEKYRSVSRE